MKTKIINGEKIAARMKSAVKSEFFKLMKLHGCRKPVLSVLSVGNNPSASVYAARQKSICSEIGVDLRPVVLPEKISEKNLVDVIERQNDDSSITGIMVQMPLPGKINPQKIRSAIKPEKDVEGVTPHNLGILFYRGATPAVAPCTALSVMECIKSAGIRLKGKNVVIVGHSEIVGKPLCLMLLSSATGAATPTVCHIATKNLKNHTKNADILIVAVGIPDFIKKDMVKRGAVVIDVGINLVKNKITGDVRFGEVKKKAGYITTVPGGVGAVTSAFLMKNLLSLYKCQIKSGRV